MTIPPLDASESDSELLARYVVGALTPAQRSELEGRLAREPQLKAELAALRELWEQSRTALRAEVTREEVDAGWARLEGALHARQAPRSRTGSAPVRSGRFRSVAAPTRRPALLAASVVVALAGGFLWRELAPRSEAEATVVREYRASPASALTVAFGDGSRVVLSPGSRLTAPLRFEASAREVTLDGRGYFEVAEDQERPFEVRSGALLTRVLGTEFEVAAYADAGEVQVTVRSGRVEVRSIAETGAPARLVGPRERATVRGTSVSVERGVDVDALTGWTAGRLDFDAVPLRRVVPELERWFQVEIDILDPALADRRLTASFRNESLDDALRSVAILVEAEVRRVGNRVEFSTPRSPTPINQAR